jgi:hypothetical protein
MNTEKVELDVLKRVAELFHRMSDENLFFALFTPVTMSNPIGPFGRRAKVSDRSLIRIIATKTLRKDCEEQKRRDSGSNFFH